MGPRRRYDERGRKGKNRRADRAERCLPKSTTKTRKNYAAIEAAYGKGVSDINAAQTVDAINTARREAAKAIEKAAAGSTGVDESFLDGWGNSEK